MRLTCTAILAFLVGVIIAQPDMNQFDGFITPDEVRQFDKLGENGTSKIFVSDAGAYLRVNIQSDSLYVASLCLCSENKNTIVLHTSAALGKVNYTASSDGQWTTSDTFDWKLREIDMESQTLLKRLDHLNQYGWVANNLGMGTKGTAEFIIDKSILGDGDVYIAAGLMPRLDPEKIIPLPATTAGDCADFKLVAGPPNRNYNFQPQGWYKVRL